MNNLFVLFGDDGDSNIEKVASDFIDVCVNDKDDAELLHFWNDGKTLDVYDMDVGIMIKIADIETSIAELERILTEYVCPQQKREKREQKLKVLKSILASM